MSLHDPSSTFWVLPRNFRSINEGLPDQRLMRNEVIRLCCLQLYWWFLWNVITWISLRRNFAVHLIILKLENICWYNYTESYKTQNIKEAHDTFVKCTENLIIVFRFCPWPPASPRCSLSQQSFLKNKIQILTTWSLLTLETNRSCSVLRPWGTRWRHWAPGSWMDQTHRGFPQPGQTVYWESFRMKYWTSNLTAAVDSQVDSLVHEFLQLWGMGLRHRCRSFIWSEKVFSLLF